MRHYWYTCTYGAFLKWGVPQNHPLNGIFPYKPSMLRYPHFRKLPYRSRFADSSLIPNWRNSIDHRADCCLTLVMVAPFFPRQRSLSDCWVIILLPSSYHQVIIPLVTSFAVKLDNNLNWMTTVFTIQLSWSFFSVQGYWFFPFFLAALSWGKSATARAASVAGWCGDDVRSRQAAGWFWKLEKSWKIKCESENINWFIFTYMYIVSILYVIIL